MTLDYPYLQSLRKRISHVFVKSLLKWRNAVLWGFQEVLEQFDIEIAQVVQVHAEAQLVILHIRRRKNRCQQCVFVPLFVKLIKKVSKLSLKLCSALGRCSHGWFTLIQLARRGSFDRMDAFAPNATKRTLAQNGTIATKCGGCSERDVSDLQSPAVFNYLPYVAQSTA